MEYDEHDKALIQRAKQTIWEEIDFEDQAHSPEARSEIAYIAYRKYRREQDR